eukprot:6819645-Lingulodinium_polyedra.AAC.1
MAVVTAKERQEKRGRSPEEVAETNGANGDKPVRGCRGEREDATAAAPRADPGRMCFRRGREE